MTIKAVTPNLHGRCGCRQPNCNVPSFLKYSCFYTTISFGGVECSAGLILQLISNNFLHVYCCCCCCNAHCYKETISLLTSGSLFWCHPEQLHPRPHVFLLWTICCSIHASISLVEEVYHSGTAGEWCFMAVLIGVGFGLAEGREGNQFSLGKVQMASCEQPFIGWVAGSLQQ